MTRELFNRPDSTWQPLANTFPFALLDTHPSNKYIAMQVLLNEAVATERAAVWDTKTRKIFWNPGNANALCWIEKGSELLILEESHKEDSVRPPLFATPTQSEYQHILKKVSWPGLDTISCLELKYPMGWLIDIVPSPTSKLACFVWQDQCESGIEYITWENGILEQISNIGFVANSNLIRGPVFSPDGSVIVMTFGAGIWWADEPDKPSLGGIKDVGYIIWSEIGSGKYNRININTDIPIGWKPKDNDDILKNEFLSLPLFICPHEIKINLPTDEEKIISLLS